MSTIPIDEWQRHKDTIVSLYMADNLSLKDVMLEMALRGFKASKFQYTTKLKQWGCSKNTTADVYKIIGHKLKRKGISLEDAKVTINQQLIPTKKLKKELHRYADPTLDAKLGGQSPRTPAVISISRRGTLEDSQITSSQGPHPPADAEGQTSFQSAENRGAVDTVSLPIEHRVDEELAANYGRERPLEIACGLWYGKLDLVKDLLEAGENVNGTVIGGHDVPLIKALRAENWQIVDLLITWGADVNCRPSPKSWTPLQVAVKRRRMDYVLKFVDQGADINAGPSTKWGGKTALQAAAEEGIMHIMLFLLSKGADVNAPAAHSGGATTLQAAARWGHVLMVQILLDRGASVNAPAAHLGGMTALQAAAENGSYQLVQLLLERGADVNAPASGSWGKTALQAAVNVGNFRVVQLLLDRGADVNAPAAQLGGMTALQAAASNDDLRLAQVLLARGADANDPASRSSGKSALQAAAGRGCLPLAQILLAHGADISAAGGIEDGQTALEAAAENGHLVMVQYLLNNYKGDEDKAELCKGALRIAETRGHWLVASFLKDCCDKVR